MVEEVAPVYSKRRRWREVLLITSEIVIVVLATIALVMR